MCSLLLPSLAQLRVTAADLSNLPGEDKIWLQLLPTVTQSRARLWHFAYRRHQTPFWTIGLLCIRVDVHCASRTVKVSL
jgi:hypothetical protein